MRVTKRQLRRIIREEVNRVRRGSRRRRLREMDDVQRRWAEWTPVDADLGALRRAMPGGPAAMAAALPWFDAIEPHDDIINALDAVGYTGNASDVIREYQRIWMDKFDPLYDEVWS